MCNNRRPKTSAAITPRSAWRTLRRDILRRASGGAWVAILATLPLLAAADQPATQPVLDRVRLAEQCLTFTAPPDTIGYLNGAAARAALARGGDYIDPSNPHRVRPDPDANVAVFHPRCIVLLEQAEWAAEGFPGHGIGSPSVQLFPFSSQPTVFLHERTSPAGHRRLVHVLLRDHNALRLPRNFLYDVIEPPTTTRPTRVLTKRPAAISGSGRYVGAHISYGQVDPDDPAHFTFDVLAPLAGFAQARDHPPRHSTVDARLNDDDTVTFTLRDPTLKDGL